MHPNPRRKRLWLALSFAGILVMLAGCWYFLAQRPVGSPTRANFEKVTVGMSAKEVAGILGPPGNHVSPWWDVPRR
jgi:hypothetical protein